MFKQVLSKHFRLDGSYTYLFILMINSLNKNIMKRAIELVSTVIVVKKVCY